ncbi:hypothetical protein BGZ61DRAFT_535469 [Ilyonectria robusta]|uniref:uncharacterized protein n=1 Tax=Ilyonectria robusta TaxID=1079257 RepID=UPI001E8E6B43|nr:uncharacterized protein BGZ61DRAFT_535469 [Ilyonectria robusta]KAH8680409.1 hypothetical protein BGZ61DRAFT_535469 [Ilyonectria robusta]
MDSQLLLLKCGLLIIILSAVAIAYYVTTLLLRYGKDIKATKLVWRDKYPSFENLHALFDRGDIMVSAVLVASSLQLSHPELSKVIKAHSTYKTDPWRRLVRTVTFISIMIRSKSSQRRQVINWLQKLHRSIPLFVFETNVVVFATFVFAIVKTHEFLGSITAEEADGAVKAVKSMADKLDPSDLGRKVPMTMTEVEQYLQNELQFDGHQTPKIQHEYLFLCNLLEKRAHLETVGF